MAIYKAIHNLSHGETGEIILAGSYVTDAGEPESKNGQATDPKSRRGNTKLTINLHQGFLKGLEKQQLDFLLELGAVELVNATDADYQLLIEAGLADAPEPELAPAKTIKKSNKIGETNNG